MNEYFGRYYNTEDDEHIEEFIVGEEQVVKFSSLSLTGTNSDSSTSLTGHSQLHQSQQRSLESIQRRGTTSLVSVQRGNSMATTPASFHQRQIIVPRPPNDTQLGLSQAQRDQDDSSVSLCGEGDTSDCVEDQSNGFVISGSVDLLRTSIVKPTSWFRTTSSSSILRGHGRDQYAFRQLPSHSPPTPPCRSSAICMSLPLLVEQDETTSSPNVDDPGDIEHICGEQCSSSSSTQRSGTTPQRSGTVPLELAACSACCDMITAVSNETCAGCNAATTSFTYHQNSNVEEGGHYCVDSCDRRVGAVYQCHDNQVITCNNKHQIFCQDSSSARSMVHHQCCLSGLDEALYSPTVRCHGKGLSTPLTLFDDYTDKACHDGELPRRQFDGKLLRYMIYSACCRNSCFEEPRQRHQYRASARRDDSGLIQLKHDSTSFSSNKGGTTMNTTSGSGLSDVINIHRGNCQGNEGDEGSMATDLSVNFHECKHHTTVDSDSEVVFRSPLQHTRPLPPPTRFKSRDRGVRRLIQKCVVYGCIVIGIVSLVVGVIVGVLVLHPNLIGDSKCC